MYLVLVERRGRASRLTYQEHILEGYLHNRVEREVNFNDVHEVFGIVICNGLD
jgi:hypothetical protein